MNDMAARARAAQDDEDAKTLHRIWWEETSLRGEDDDWAGLPWQRYEIARRVIDRWNNRPARCGRCQIKGGMLHLNDTCPEHGDTDLDP